MSAVYENQVERVPSNDFVRGKCVQNMMAISIVSWESDQYTNGRHELN